MCIDVRAREDSIFFFINILNEASSFVAFFSAYRVSTRVFSAFLLLGSFSFDQCYFQHFFYLCVFLF